MSGEKRNLVAMGGGGFLMEPDNPRLERYLFELSRAAHPKVCFINTASELDPTCILRFYDAFRAHPCEPSHLSLYRPPTADLRSYLLEKDVVYVGGGNTKNLIALWREWGLDRHLREAWENGTVLAGVSAGALCWFEEGVTDSIPGALTPLKCLGLLPGSHCPHYDGEKNRRPSYQRLIGEGKLVAGLAADDGAALHFRGTELHAVVSSRPQAKAYRVEREAASSGQVRETALSARFLALLG